MSLEVLEAGSPPLLKEFIDIPWSLYTESSPWVPQLKRELKALFTPGKNPFFEHADVKFFIARQKGNFVGRIVSTVNRRHNEYHNERTGFFGFFECIDDQDVASALLERAEQELRSSGMDVMRGPMNFSTNEECGMLLENFDDPPMLMTPYNHHYYNSLLDGYGMNKAKDLYAYIFELREGLPEKMHRVAEIAERRGVTVRHITKKTFEADMMAFKEVYNEAWAQNWGFIPITDEELIHTAAMLKQVMEPELVLIAEHRGEAVGFLGTLPDFNRVLKKMDGKLNPITIIKALYHSRKIKDTRMLLLGIKSRYRTRGVDAILYREEFKKLLELGYERIEFSWILEDNEAMKKIIQSLKSRLYKTYRIYEKPLA